MIPVPKAIALKPITRPIQPPTVVKELTPRAVLGASLPSFYPQAPADSSVDVCSLTVPAGLTLEKAQSRLCQEDKDLWNQVRRFNGPWLLSRWDGDDDLEWAREGDEEDVEGWSPRNAVIMASNDFLKRFEYDAEDVINEDCGFLQRETGGINVAANSKLTKSFADGCDVHAILLNYKKNGDRFKR